MKTLKTSSLLVPNFSHIYFNLLYNSLVGGGTSKVCSISLLRLRRHSLLDSSFNSFMLYRGAFPELTGNLLSARVLVINFHIFPFVLYLFNCLVNEDFTNFYIRILIMFIFFFELLEECYLFYCPKSSVWGSVPLLLSFLTAGCPCRSCVESPL